MRNVPSFCLPNGKWICNREEVTALTNAVYADMTKVTVKGKTINILSSERTDDNWTVQVEIESELKYEAKEKHESDESAKRL